MAQYAEIVEIVVPAEAVAGSRVDITVRIKNKHASAIGIMAGGALEYGVTPWPGITYPTSWANVGGGVTYSFAGYFTMPPANVKIHAYSYFYTEEGWRFDDEKTKDVKVTQPVSGVITRKELEYDSARATIPASNIPQGKRGLVHSWGRNDTGQAQQMGVYWLVRDPDGYPVEEHSEWEMWPYTGAGKEHEFIGGRFDLLKAGRYTISVQLFMKVDGQSPVLDSYYGTLCDVKAAVPEPEFTGMKISNFVRV
jgi:hypothetical protein